MSPDFGQPPTPWPEINGPEIAGAQARRDRSRLGANQAEIDALRRRVAALEGSLPFRAKAILTNCLNVGLRKANSAKRRLVRVNDLATAPPVLPVAVAGRGRALVIDHHWPTPDRDSGSIDIVTMVRSLERLGFEVELAASKQHEGLQPARLTLLAQGIACLQPETSSSVASYLAEQGGHLDLVVLCRVYCGGEFLELVQKHCNKARIIFNSIDLCFMRVERQARLLDDPKIFDAAARIRRREEQLIDNCDATIVVSQTEFDLLAQTHPESMTAMLPLAREVHVPRNGFAERRNIGFIGGFAHAPNVDAVRYFLREIWPRIHARLPDCGFDIVGADAPADLIDGVSRAVRLLGHMPDVQPWFESLRLTVAPLRYGAGAKGKVATSLAAGVPCVVTEIAAEGMMLGVGDGVIVADGADAFAEAVISAYADALSWPSLSADGVAYANRSLSLARWQAQLDRVLIRIGF